MGCEEMNTLRKIRDALIIVVLGAILIDLIHGLENFGFKTIVGGY